MTLSCQAEDFFILWGLNGSHFGIEFGANTQIIHHRLSQCFGMPSANCFVFIYVWPHRDKIFEFISFQA